MKKLQIVLLCYLNLYTHGLGGLKDEEVPTQHAAALQHRSRLCGGGAIDFDLTNRQVIGSGGVATEDTYKKVNFKFNFETGWYVNLWGGFDADGFHEVDYTAGYVWQPHPSSSWSIDLSVNWYDVNTVGTDTDGDLFVPIIEVTYNAPDAPWSLYAAIEPMFVNNDSKQNGVVTYIGGNVNLLSFYGVEFHVGGRAGYHGTFNNDRWYARADFQPQLQLNKKPSYACPA